MGTMLLHTAPEKNAGHEGTSAQPGGRLFVPPAYLQTTGDEAVPVRVGQERVAVAFTPDVDFAISGVSVYAKSVQAAGTLSVRLYEDGLVPEPNGKIFSPASVNALTPLTENGEDCEATSETTGFEAFRAFDHQPTWQNGWRSTAAPTAASPQSIVRDLGEGNEQVFNRFRLYPFAFSDANVRAFPRSFSIDADHGDDHWVTLVNVAGENDPGLSMNSSAMYRQYTVVNTTAYRRYRVRITDRNGTADHVSIGEIEMFSPEMQAGPTFWLDSLGVVDFDASLAGQWVRVDATNSRRPHGVQVYRGKTYWLVFSATEGSLSLSKRRVNSANGSMFPESCRTKESPDGGFMWTEAWQEGQPAMLNLVVHSTANHVPHLVYGRAVGSHVSLYRDGTWQSREIPLHGLSLSLEEHSTPDPVYGYRVFVAEEDGVLVLSAERFGLAYPDGVPVHGGMYHKRFVGLVYPVERLPGRFGPIACPDELLVWNQYHRKGVRVGKDCPYVSPTLVYPCAQQWVPYRNDDFRIRVLCGEPARYTATLSPLYTGNYEVWTALAVNQATPVRHIGPSEDTTGVAHRVDAELEPRLNTIHPVLRHVHGGYWVQLWREHWPNPQVDRVPKYAASCVGWLEG